MKLFASLILLISHGILHAACACDPDVVFTQKPEWSGPASASFTVDADLGNTPSAFVTAAWEQVFGVAPSAATVTTQVNNLLTLPYWRRIDVVHSFINTLGLSRTVAVSDPWISQPD